MISIEEEDHLTCTRGYKLKKRVRLVKEELTHDEDQDLTHNEKGDLTDKESTRSSRSDL